MNPLSFYVLQILMLCSALGIVRARVLSTEARLNWYLVVTVLWTVLQSLSFTGLYYGGWS